MITKSSKIFIIIIIGVIGLLTYLEASEPDPVNWFPSYAKADKIPLGTFASYELIKESLGIEKLNDVSLPPYELLTNSDTVSGTYFFINGTINFDKDELNTILDWVQQGNTLFVSAKTIEHKLLDTLNLEIDNLISLNEFSTKPIVNLINPKLKSATPFLYDRDIYNPYFKEIDTATTIILGISQLYNDTLKIKTPNVNYLQQDFGKGQILLHTFPEAFGNYFVLKNKNYQYTQNLLAYINKDQKVYWDNYYKSGKSTYTSPLFFLLKNRYLKWAYYFVLIGAVLFVIFEGKRKQRSIPVITPLKNQTLAFTRTISGMYFEKQKHKEIVTKQNLLFLDYVREVLRIPTNTLDQKTIDAIAARSNNTLEDTRALFKYFDKLDKKSRVEKEELMRLYELVSQFKEKV